MREPQDRSAFLLCALSKVCGPHRGACLPPLALPLPLRLRGRSVATLPAGWGALVGGWPLRDAPRARPGKVLCA